MFPNQSTVNQLSINCQPANQLVPEQISMEYTGSSTLMNTRYLWLSPIPCNTRYPCIYEKSNFQFSFLHRRQIIVHFEKKKTNWHMSKKSFSPMAAEHFLKYQKRKVPKTIEYPILCVCVISYPLPSTPPLAIIGGALQKIDSERVPKNYISFIFRFKFFASQSHLYAVQRS